MLEFLLYAAYIFPTQHEEKMLFKIFPSIEKKRRSRNGSGWLSQLGAIAQVRTLGPRVGCRFLSVSVSLGYEGGIR